MTTPARCDEHLSVNGLAADEEAEDVADPGLCNSASSPPGGGDLGGRARSVTAADALVEWADVSYRPLADARVATIPYSPRFAAVFGLLQVAREREEASPRALALVTEATRLCAADFSTWGYRMCVIRGLLSGTEAGPAGAREREAILLAEDKFVRDTSESVPKSYQLWEYRRFLFGLKRREADAACADEDGARSSVDALVAEERAFVDAALDNDDKNYHAWSHRGWLSREAVPRSPTAPSAATSNGGSPLSRVPDDAELIATGARIRRDVRNNSAYAHRWAAGAGASRGMPEVSWALDRARLAPRNEAAWNYVLALSARVPGATAAAVAAALGELAEDEGNVPARRVLVLAEGEGACGVEEKVAHCRLLATEMDIERYRYWMWKMDKLANGASRDPG